MSFLKECSSLELFFLAMSFLAWIVIYFVVLISAP